MEYDFKRNKLESKGLVTKLTWDCRHKVEDIHLCVWRRARKKEMIMFKKIYGLFTHLIHVLVCLPGDSDGKESTCNAGDPGSIPGLGKIPWRRE